MVNTLEAEEEEAEAEKEAEAKEEEEAGLGRQHEPSAAAAAPLGCARCPLTAASAARFKMAAWLTFIFC